MKTPSFSDPPTEESGGTDPASRARAARGLPPTPKADRQQEILDEIPESKRGDPVPGSSGRQVPDAPNEDEDDGDGANEAARLVNEGIELAAQDQANQAAPDPQGPDTSRL